MIHVESLFVDCTNHVMSLGFVLYRKNNYDLQYYSFFSVSTLSLKILLKTTAAFVIAVDLSGTFLVGALFLGFCVSHEIQTFV